MQEKTRQSNSIIFIQVSSNDDIKRGLEDIIGRPEVRGVILSFEDEKSFASQNHPDERILKRFKHCPIPIILIIEQITSGFITELVAASHLCISADSAKFEIKDTEKLKLQIGSKNQSKLNPNKKLLNAEIALDLGFINKVVPQENLEQAALDMAEKIADLAPLTIRSCLQAVNQGLEMDLEKGLKLETELFTKIFASRDMKEGTDAFLEKRKPKFYGR